MKQDKISVEGIGRQQKLAILEKGDTLEIYEDYSVRVKCSRCGKWNGYGKDTKQAIMVNQNKEMAIQWLCDVCYREEQTPPNPQDVTQERIMRGQAMNCAVAIVAPSHIGKSSDNLKQDIIVWRDWFLEELKKSNGK